MKHHLLVILKDLHDFKVLFFFLIILLDHTQTMLSCFWLLVSKTYTMGKSEIYLNNYLLVLQGTTYRWGTFKEGE